MTNKNRWERIEHLYHAALEREPAARDAFLDETCRDDDDLRREVDSLLKFDGKAKSFIEHPALELEARAIASEGQSQTEANPLPDIGPYHLLSIIGRGGMGEIHLAVDTRLDRKVAIKLLSAEFTEDAERIFRFKQEARTTSALNHPNIVTIHEIGELNGRQYIVAEYAEGHTVRELISASANQINLKEALSIAIQVIDALAAAHQAGIIHRDIKPENIVVRKDGLVKVLDFGIAKLLGRDLELRPDWLTTQTGIILGTASYMSPEQARGQKVDHRSDIFSFGAVLYEMLSGRKPFEGDTPSDVMAAVLVKDPVRIDLIAPNLPPALQRIVERCLEKSPERRFQSASDLSFALKELVTSVTGAENRVPEVASSGNAAPLHSARNWKHLAWVAAIALPVLIAGAITLKSTFRDKSPVTPSQVKLPWVGNGDSKLRLIWFDRAGNQIGIVGEPGWFSNPALSPNEDRIVVALNDPQTRTRDLWIFPATSGKGSQLTVDPADDLNPVWTPDGKWIIYTSERNGVRNIYRIAADGSSAGEPLFESPAVKSVEDISADGRLVIFNFHSQTESEPDLGILSLSNRTSKVFFASPSREDAARFSPDGRWVAYRSREQGSQIIVRRMTPGGVASSEKWQVSNGNGDATQPMWRGDGKEMFYLAQKVLMAVDVNANGRSFSSGPPRALFNMNIEDSERRNRFLMTKDGQRFLVVAKEETKP